MPTKKTEKKTTRKPRAKKTEAKKVETPEPSPTLIEIKPDNLTLARQYLVAARDEIKRPGVDARPFRNRIDEVIMVLDELYQDMEKAAEEELLTMEIVSA